MKTFLRKHFLRRHCDDVANDPTTPACVRAFLDYARAKAHGEFEPKPHPKLFADYRGTRVRVVMASRLGDVGITTDLTAEYGYSARVFIDRLNNFSATEAK